MLVKPMKAVELQETATVQWMREKWNVHCLVTERGKRNMCEICGIINLFIISFHCIVINLSVVRVHNEVECDRGRWQCGEYTLLADFPASDGAAQSVWYTTVVQHQLSASRYSGVCVWLCVCACVHACVRVIMHCQRTVLLHMMSLLYCSRVVCQMLCMSLLGESLPTAFK